MKEHYQLKNRSFKMIKLAITIAVLAVPSFSIDQKLMDKIGKYNVLSRCWGEEAVMAYTTQVWEAAKHCQRHYESVKTPANSYLEGLRGSHSPLDVPVRSKRDASDKIELMEDVMAFNSGIESNFGNLSCVLTQMDMLDADGNINIERYSMATLYPYLKDTPAGSAPGFLQKLVNGFYDCYNITNNWPQQNLDRHPLTKEHGRHMIFFECAKNIETKMCAQFEISQWMESFYGDYAAALNLPMDKYDAAEVAMKAMHQQSTPEEKFLDDFFWPYMRKL